MGDAHNFLANCLSRFTLYYWFSQRSVAGNWSLLQSCYQDSLKPNTAWFVLIHVDPHPNAENIFISFKARPLSCFPFACCFLSFFLMFSSAFLNISVSPPSWPAACTSNWPRQLASAAACHLFFFGGGGLRLNLGKFYFSTESCLFSHTALLLLIQCHVIVLSPA